MPTDIQAAIARLLAGNLSAAAEYYVSGDEEDQARIEAALVAEMGLKADPFIMALRTVAGLLKQ